MRWLTLQTERAIFLQWYSSVLGSTLRIIGYFFAAVSLILLVLNLLIGIPSGLLATALVGLAVGLLVVSVDGYIWYLKLHPWFLISPKLVTSSPLNGCDFSVLTVLRAWQRSHDWAVLWANVLQQPAAAVILYRLGLNPANIGQFFPRRPATDEEIAHFTAALVQRAQAANQRIADIYTLLYQLLEQPESQTFLQQLNVTPQRAVALARFYQEQSAARQDQRRQRLFNHYRTGGFAKSWSIAYTSLLDVVTEEITVGSALKIGRRPLYSREEILHQMVAELNKSAGQNILLVGEPGVGKREVFLHLAARVLSYQTKSALDGAQIRILNIPRLLALATAPEQLAALMERLANELSRAGNVIIFIDEVETLLDPSALPGTNDLRHLFAQYLQNSQLRIIATITPEANLTLIKPDRILASHFTTIDIPQPEGDELTNILLDRLPTIEQRYAVLFLLEAVEAIINLAARYLKNEVSPSRELNLAEEVATWCHAHSQPVVTAAAVTQVLETQVKVPIQVKDTERRTLLQLEKYLHQRIVGQDEAIRQLSDALLRARAGLGGTHRPLGSFLFLGPTGVGKTETAKTLAAVYFGSQDQMIQLDMTEYADANGLIKLLGTDAVHQPGTLTLAIQQRPAAVVLLDELEKASLPVQNLLLQLLDEGRLTTNYGTVLDFTNTMVIATSNAASTYIADQVTTEAGRRGLGKTIVHYLIEQRIFPPELINRFDGVIVYQPLTLTEIKQIVKLQLGYLQERLKKDKGLELTVGPSVVEELTKRGYDPVFGARALQRIIQSDLETAIARAIIEQDPKPGSAITVSSLS